MALSPLPSLRALTERELRVRDVVSQPIWCAKPRQRACEAAIELTALGYDIAALAEEPIARYVRVPDLLRSDGMVAGVARPILATDVISGDLPLVELLDALAERDALFVLNHDRVTTVVTRADLQAPAVSIVALAYLIAMETALSTLLRDDLGSGLVRLLSKRRQQEVLKLFTRLESERAELGLEDCLYFSDWQRLAKSSPSLLTELAVTKKQWDKRTTRLVQLRNDLAHGRTLFDQDDVEGAIAKFKDVRHLTERLWEILDRRSGPWGHYLDTTIRRRGRGRRPVAGRNAARTWEWSKVAHVITAWNAQSVVRPDAVNRVANDHLSEMLQSRGLDVEPVIGESDTGTWREESLLVSGLRRQDAAELGLRFGQLAVFELDADECRVVRCVDAALVGARPRCR